MTGGVPVTAFLIRLLLPPGADPGDPQVRQRCGSVSGGVGIALNALLFLGKLLSGLEMGADDYIVKPFEMKEVLARIHAVLRRTAGGEEEGGAKKLAFDKLVINLDSYELIVNGQPVDTPPKELELLFHLASSPNRVFTRNQLLDEVWGFDYFGDSRTVDVHIKRLREKLEGVSDQWRLKTVWGVGYKFEVSPAGTPG